MNLVLTAEQGGLAESIRRFVAERSPISVVRAVVDSGREFDESVWRQMVDQLDLPAMAIPKQYGGNGCGQTELCVVFRELGRGLVPSPLLASGVLAAQLLMHTGDEDARRRFLPRIASGEIIVTAAVTEPGRADDGWVVLDPVVTAVAAGGNYRLSGTKSAVLNASAADYFIVLAAQVVDCVADTALFVVAADDPAVRIVRLVNPDGTRQVSRVEFDGAAAERIAGLARAPLVAAALRGSLMIAAEQSGAIETCLTTTTDYAKIRHAFGSPIGAFQGVKHPLAQTKVALELGWSLVLDAARRTDIDSDTDVEGATGGDAAADIAVHAARSFVTTAYSDAAYDMVQLHGGTGYTWEHDAQLFYKNATFSGQLLGGAEHHLDRLADLVLPQPPETSVLT